MCQFLFLTFFFKQKTAYELLRSLVGSEMCIRDSEYLKYMFVFEDEAPESMAQAIDRVLNKDKTDLIQKATLAQEFVIKEKNWSVQSNKIIGFIEKVVNEKC